MPFLKLNSRILAKSLTRALLTCAVLLLVACSRDEQLSPEAAVKATLEQLEQAAEERSLSKFMRHISDDYSDHQGYSKDDIRKLIQLQYIRNQNIYIFSTINTLSVDGDVATIEVSAAMAARAADLEGQRYLLADTHNFSIVMQSPDKQKTWLVEAVSWDRGWK